MIRHFLRMFFSLHQSKSNHSSVDQSSVLVFLPLPWQQEELRQLMGWPSGVIRTRIRVTEVNFSEFLITGKGNLVRVIARIWVIRGRVRRVKNYWKVLWKLVRVCGRASSSYPVSSSYRRSDCINTLLEYRHHWHVLLGDYEMRQS